MLHPALGDVRDLFQPGRLSFVFNVGPLVAPMTRQDYINGTVAVPYSLFGHDDQSFVWQSSVSDRPVATGWGGRMADLLYSLNGNSRVSMCMSTANTNTFQVGQRVFQFHVSPRRGAARRLHAGLGVRPGFAGDRPDVRDPESEHLRARLQLADGWSARGPHCSPPRWPPSRR